MSLQKIQSITKDATVNVALDTIKLEKQGLIFVNTKRSAEKVAELIATQRKKQQVVTLPKLAEKIKKATTKPTKQCERLAYCIEQGIAFHHAGLTSKQKTLIENKFRDGTIKIIAATPTLAVGIDMPAYRSIIRDVRRYTRRGLQHIPVLEFHQMAGRAGRPSYDTHGEAICIAATPSEKRKIIRKFIEGDPEELYSKLAVEPVLRTYILSLIATNIVETKKELLAFFSKTLWAHQFDDLKHLEQLINKMISLLKEEKFIMTSQDDFTSADQLDKDELKATMLGQRVTRLYIDPLTAKQIISNLENAKQKETSPISFLLMITQTLEMRPLLSIRKKDTKLLHDAIATHETCFLQEEPTDFDEYNEFLKAVKTAVFLYEWIQEKNEEFLLEQFNIRPGEVHTKLNYAEWILYCAQELAKITKQYAVINEISKLRTRLKYGAKEELLPLLKLRGIGRVRARTLYNNGIKTIKEVKKVDLSTLQTLIGKKPATTIKKQVGEKVENREVSPRKRTGQVSLGKFEKK